MHVTNKARGFNLSNAADQDEYEEFVNSPNVDVIQKVDGLSRDGEAIRLVEIRERDPEKAPVYQPPVC